MRIAASLCIALPATQGGLGLRRDGVREDTVRPARAALLTCTLAASLGGLACGEANITRTGRTPVVQQSDGRLNRDPDPLSVADIQRLPADAPESVVYRVWFYAQWGSSISIPRYYDARVVKTLGAVTIANAFARDRDDIVRGQPRLRGVVRTPGGRLVTLQVLSAKDRPRLESFLLRRRAGGWRIVHDSLLEDALRTDAQVLTQQRVDPGGAHADPRAITAGIRAAARYRRLYAGSR
jgi:hypothetical protein